MVLKTFIWGVLICSCKIKTLEKQKSMKLLAAKTLIWRRITKASWIARKTNEKILDIVNERK